MSTRENIRLIAKASFHFYIFEAITYNCNEINYLNMLISIELVLAYEFSILILYSNVVYSSFTKI